MKFLIQNSIQYCKNFEEKLPKYAPYVYMLASCFLFSLMNLLLKFCKSVPVYEIIYIRCIVNVILCLIVINYQKYELYFKDQKTNILLIIRGIMGGTAFTLFIYGVYFLPLSVISGLQTTTPLWVGILGALFYSETYKLIHVITGVLSFIGIILIFKPNFLFGNPPESEIHDQYVIGVILIIIQTILGAFIQLTIRALRDRSNVLVLVFYYSFINIIISGVGQIVETVRVLSLLEYFLAILIGIVCFGGQLMGARAFYLEKAFILSILTYSQIIFNYFFDIFIFNETIDSYSYLGILFLTSSMGVLVYSKNK